MPDVKSVIRTSINNYTYVTNYVDIVYLIVEFKVVFGLGWAKKITTTWNT